MNKNLIILGTTIILIGLFWPIVKKIPFGSLPGDLSYKSGNLKLYLPIGTCIMISLILSLLLKVIGYFSGKN